MTPRKNIVCDTLKYVRHIIAVHTMTAFYIMTRGSRGFNAAKAITSSAEETKKLQFISSNCPDGITTGHPAVSSQPPLPRG